MAPWDRAPGGSRSSTKGALAGKFAAERCRRRPRMPPASGAHLRTWGAATCLPHGAPVSFGLSAASTPQQVFSVLQHMPFGSGVRTLHTMPKVGSYAVTACHCLSCLCMLRQACSARGREETLACQLVLTCKPRLCSSLRCVGWMQRITMSVWGVRQVKGGYHGGDQETAARLDIPRQQPRPRHQG